MELVDEESLKFASTVAVQPAGAAVIDPRTGDVGEAVEEDVGIGLSAEGHLELDGTVPSTGRLTRREALQRTAHCFVTADRRAAARLRAGDRSQRHASEGVRVPRKTERRTGAPRAAYLVDGQALGDVVGVDVRADGTAVADRRARQLADGDEGIGVQS